MYDNITIKYDEAESVIGLINSFWIIPKLKEKIKNGSAEARDYAFIANAYNIRGESKKALRYALRAIQKDKKYAYGYLLAGQVLFDRNKNKKARKYIDKAIKLGGEDYYFALFYKLQLYIYDDNYDEAYKIGKSYLKINCDYPDYYLFRAIIKMQFSLDFKEVLEDVKLAMKNYIKYNHPFFIFEGIYVSVIIFLTGLFLNITASKWKRVNKAMALASLGRDNEVLDIYKNFSLKKNLKKKEELSKELLNVYFSNGDYEKCIALANKFLVEYKSAYVYMYKARCYDCLGKYEKAVKNIDKASKYDDEFREHRYFYWKSKFAFHASKYDLAIKYINKQILYDQIPDSENYMIKGVSYYMLDNIDQALDSFLEALQCDDETNRDDICWWLAKLYYEKKEYNKALIYVDIAIMENKDHYNYNLKGDILIALKRIKEARAYYKKAEKILNN